MYLFPRKHYFLHFCLAYRKPTFLIRNPSLAQVTSLIQEGKLPGLRYNSKRSGGSAYEVMNENIFSQTINFCTSYEGAKHENVLNILSNLLVNPLY